MRMGRYLGISTGHLQIGADICAVPTADTVTNGEVNCYNSPLTSIVWGDDQPGVGPTVARM